MADESETEAGDENGDGADVETTERSTAPQSDYTVRDIVVGAVIGLVGLLVTFGVPLAATL